MTEAVTQSKAQILVAFMKEQRIESGLTKSEVAKKIPVTLSAYEKWEKGDRVPSGPHLTAWCAALGVPHWARQKILTLASGGLYDLGSGSWPPELTELDYEHLAAFPFPAFFRKLPDYDIVAANQAALQLVPCYTPAPITAHRPANFLEAMFTDRRARTLFGNWSPLAHRMVYLFRTLSPGVVPAQRIAQIVETCKHAPEFELFWNTAPDHLDDDTVILQHPDTGEPAYFALRSYTTGFPARPYELLTMTPRTPDDPAAHDEQTRELVLHD